MRSVGPRHFVEATLSLPRSLGLEQVAEVKSGAMEAVRSALPDAEATIQSIPVSPSDETVRDRALLVAMRERVAVHHITVQHLGDDIAISLDLEVNGVMPLAEAHGVADRLEAIVRREFSERTEIDIHVEPLKPEVRDVEDLPAALKQSFIAALERAAREISALSDLHKVCVRRSGRGYVPAAHCRLDADATAESVHRCVDDLERLVRERRPDIARIVIHAEPTR